MLEGSRFFLECGDWGFDIGDDDVVLQVTDLDGDGCGVECN